MFCIIGSAIQNAMQAMTGNPARTILPDPHRIQLCMRAGPDMRLVSSTLKQRNLMRSPSHTLSSMIIKWKIMMVQLQTSHLKAKDTTAVIVSPVKWQKVFH